MNRDGSEPTDFMAMVPEHVRQQIKEAGEQEDAERAEAREAGRAAARRRLGVDLPGRFSGRDATPTERAAGDAKEEEDERGLRREGAAHRVLRIYGDGKRRTAYDASFECEGDYHSKRRESTRLLDRGLVRKAGTLPNRSPAGRPEVDAYVITQDGYAELWRLDHDEL